MSDTKADKEPPPWTIRGVEPEIRNALLEAAKREKQTMGEWLNRQGRALILSDRQRTRAPVPVPAPSDTPSDAAPMDSLSDLAAAVERLAGIDGVPKGVMASMFGLVRDRAKADRAALARQTKRPALSDNEGDSV